MKNKIKNEVVNVEAVIDEWISRLVHGTVFQTETAMYNKLHNMVIELKQKLSNSKSDVIDIVALETPSEK